MRLRKLGSPEVVGGEVPFPYKHELRQGTSHCAVSFAIGGF